MTPAGLLLPESFLFSTGFRVFAIFVALNTLIYLGLTAGRLVLWPRPIQPHRLAHLQGDLDPQEISVNEPAPALRQLGNPATRLRIESAFQTIPVALTLTGALALIFTLVQVVTSTQGSLVSDIAGAIFAVAVLAVAQVAGRRVISPGLLPWIWSLSLAGVVIFISWQAVEESRTVTLSYSIVILVALIPIALSWIAGLAGGFLAAGATLVAAYFTDASQIATWLLILLTAIAAGSILLQLRFIGLDRIAAEQARTATLLTTDPLTGALSRRGLDDLAPSVWNAAATSDQSVYAVVATIDDLLEINDRYGIAYGDDVIIATFRSLRRALPEGALIARWTAGSYAAVGIGGPRTDDLAQAFAHALEDSGIALGKKAPAVSLRQADGKPALTSSEALIAEASGASPTRL